MCAMIDGKFSQAIDSDYVKLFIDSEEECEVI
jgi:hypothetical protein